MESVLLVVILCVLAAGVEGAGGTQKWVFKSGGVDGSPGHLDDTQEQQVQFQTASYLRSLYICIAIAVRTVLSFRRGLHPSRLRHNLAVGFVFSLISIGNIKIVQAQQAHCSYSGSLPCMYGDCTFSKDANGTLTKTGTCSGSTGTLYLNSKGITALSADVFHQVGMT